MGLGIDQSSSVDVQVLMESREQRRQALRFVSNMKGAFPEVLQTIKTHQLAQELLLYKEAYLHVVHKTGRLSRQSVLMDPRFQICCHK